MDDTEEDISPPGAHDLIEVEQDLIWEIEDWAAYKVTSRCQRDGCDGKYRSVTIIGSKIETMEEFKTIAYQIYESYYDKPRNIPYRVLQCLVNTSDPRIQNPVAEDLSDAAKLGRNDADEDREKRPKRELFDTVLPDNP
jgi:hypothetical protein